MTHFLYVIVTAEGWRRVGKTKGLVGRLQQHRCKLCSQADIEITVGGSPDYIHRLERLVLGRLRRYRIRGDLFDCGGGEAQAAVLDAIRGVPLSDFETIAEVVAAFGTHQDFADALKVKRGRVEKWCNRNTVPVAMVAPIVWLCRSRGMDAVSADFLIEVTAASLSSGAAA